MGFDEIFQKFGLPIGTAVFFIYQYIKAEKEHKEDLRGILQLVVTALNKNTDSLDENTKSKAASDTVLQRATDALNRRDG